MAGCHHLRRQVGGGLHRAVEAILRPRDDARARLDALPWRGAAERVDELVVLRDPAQRGRARRDVREAPGRRGRWRRRSGSRESAPAAGEAPSLHAAITPMTPSGALARNRRRAHCAFHSPRVVLMPCSSSSEAKCAIWRSRRNVIRTRVPSQPRRHAHTAAARVRRPRGARAPRHRQSTSRSPLRNGPGQGFCFAGRFAEGAFAETVTH